MRTYRLETVQGKTHTIKARSWRDAIGEVHDILKGTDDKKLSLYTVKPEKPSDDILAGHKLVRETVLQNTMITKLMDEIEASYKKYWEEARERSSKITPEEIDRRWPKDKYGGRGSEYLNSEYRQVKSWGGLSEDPRTFLGWIDFVNTNAAEAREKSISKMVHAITKIADKEPITIFRVIDVWKGRAGLEGMVKVNNTVKRLFAIIASGPIQTRHIRYLIK